MLPFRKYVGLFNLLSSELAGNFILFYKTICRLKTETFVKSFTILPEHCSYLRNIGTHLTSEIKNLIPNRINFYT